MPLFTSTFFFKQGSQGWTENWSRNSSDSVAMIGPSADLARALVVMRATQTAITAIRISEAAVPRPRAGQFFKFLRSGTRQKLTQTTSPDPAATAALVRVQVQSGPPRGILLRGMSDDDVLRDPVSLEAEFLGAWSGLIDDLRSALFGDNWGFAAFDSSTAWSGVTAMTKDATIAGNWNLLLLPGITPPNVGSYVHFRGVNRRQLPWLKGNFKVVAIQPAPAGGLSINVRPDLQPSVSGQIDTSRMFWRASTFTLNQAIQLAPIDWRKRATGRPISLTRGREPGIKFRR